MVGRTGKGTDRGVDKSRGFYKKENEKHKSRAGLVHLTLGCEQGCIEDFRQEKFKWQVNLLPSYKTMPTILKRQQEDGRTIIYDLTYHGPGNQFIDEFPEHLSEYDFTGFCYYEDNPDKKGNFNAKIIS